MQYSSDGKNWGFSSNALFDENKIAKTLRLKEGEWIYYREKEGDVERKLQWGKSNEKPKRVF